MPGSRSSVSPSLFAKRESDTSSLSVVKQSQPGSLNGSLHDFATIINFFKKNIKSEQPAKKGELEDLIEDLDTDSSTEPRKVVPEEPPGQNRCIFV